MRRRDACPHEDGRRCGAHSGDRARPLSKAGGRHKVANLGRYAKNHPDPTDTENNPGDSNPYGVAVARGGSVLVADAAANALRRVTRWGRITTVAHFPVQKISTAHIPDPNLPPTLPAEAVPTTVAVGPDGYWYVGELKGFPFTPRTSRIWRIKPGTTNAMCSPTKRQRTCGMVAHDFTSIIDLTFDHRGGMDVFEIAKAGVGALESADPSKPLPPAALYRVKNGKRTELAAGKLFIGGGVAAPCRTGSLYVTDFQIVPDQGRLLRVR